MVLLVNISEFADKAKASIQLEYNVKTKESLSASLELSNCLISKDTIISWEKQLWYLSGL